MPVYIVKMLLYRLSARDGGINLCGPDAGHAFKEMDDELNIRDRILAAPRVPMLLHGHDGRCIYAQESY